MRVELICHPDTPCDIVDRIEVDIVPAGGCVEFTYRAIGRIASLRLPRADEQSNVEELWKTTCFEMFGRTLGSPRYDELNLSPSGKWAQFSFSDYREGRRLLRTVPPKIATEVTSDRFCLAAHGAMPEKRPWLVGLSAVIEEMNGRISYWALAHPPGDPDFHHPDSFALELPPSR